MPHTFVRQRRNRDCCIATAAIAAKVSYELAAAEASALHTPNDSGFRPVPIGQLLWRLTGTKWDFRRPSYCYVMLSKLFDFAVTAKGRAFCWIANPRLPGGNHGILLDGLDVFDPLETAVKGVARYDRRDWRVVFVYPETFESARSPLSVLTPTA